MRDKEKGSRHGSIVLGPGSSIALPSGLTAWYWVETARGTRNIGKKEDKHKRLVLWKPLNAPHYLNDVCVINVNGVVLWQCIQYCRSKSSSSEVE